MSDERAGGASGLRDRLSPEQRQKLLQGFLTKRAVGVVDERIPRRAQESPPPLSFAQQRLWVAHRVDPGSAVYNMPSPLRLRGALDGVALRRSLHEVVRRHESLRTTFGERDGEPVQLVHPPAPAALPLVDLRALPAAAREPEALRLVEAEALRPFDLARRPPLRSTLLRLDEEDHVLCFTLHHIVSDAWSEDVLVREVSALYDAFSRGEPSPLPELPVQYADFAVWQRARLSGEALEAQIGYWRERLAGAPPLLEIPTDRPRSVGGDAGTGVHPFALSPEATRALEDLSRREGTTLFMTIMAAWMALLSRYSGQEDVVVGSANAGRDRHETQGLIGFFINMLVLRGDLSGDPTWRELLARVRATALGAYAHQELPFDRIVDELGVERSPTHSPLFQALFNLGRSTGREARLELNGMRLESFGEEVANAKFDLNLMISETGSGLGGVLAYREALFEAGTIARMAEHLAALLHAMPAAPERRISEVSLLRGAERARVLEEWNSTAAGNLSERSVHELFAGQAARTPHAPALAFGDETHTYAELDRAANRLAHRLVGLGVGPEARVTVLLEPSAGFVVALLAVLKAGGAYLPLEPSTPPERLAFLLEDAGASVVITTEGSRSALRRTRAAVVCPDADAEELSRESSDAPSVGVRPENAAYLIYTSGSTGQPKGVVVEHRQLANYVRAIAERLGLEGGMSHALVSTVAADLGNTVLFPSLCTGGALHVVPRETATSGERFAAYVQRHGIDVVKIVPSHLAALLGAGGAEVLPRRTLVLGGEASRTAWVDELRGRAPGLTVVNHYGPTETTVGVATHRVGQGEERGGTVPLGRPLANSRLYVLDRFRQPVPLGAPGELYVGGAQVARGYAGRPDQTAERFVPDPFGPEPGGRLYRTGDRVRWRASGELEFLGRVDAQVKVRGFRVELGEVEAMLAAHAAVREAAVVLREDVEGQPRLVAYVVAEAGADAGAAGLADYLRERLPEYMVPAAYVALDAMPLNANGKLDRRALPAPEETARYVAPRSATEEVLAGIWEEVLGVERVGVDASFFELGGDSLLGIRMVSRVRKALGVKLQMKVLFEAGTLAALATLVEGQRGGAAAAPPIERVARGGPLPLSFAQQRLWLVDRMEPGNPAYNLPYALRLRGTPDVDALRWSLEALVERHEPLRTVFAEQGGEPVQLIRTGAPPAFEVLDLSGLPDPEGEARRLAEEEALRPFDLARGPLLRSTLLRLGADDHVLLFTMHHIVSDGSSRDVLVREVSALYAARGRGREPGLPALPVQYADYAAWQRARLGGGGLEEQAAWWRSTLAGAPPLLELPTDHPRAAGQGSRAGAVGFELPREVAEGVRALARKEGATLFMTVLAGWQALLARWSGQDDVVVGTPVAGRTRTELEGLIGFFVNMLPMRLELGGDPTFAALVGRVRDRALGAYEHQEVPFERLVEELATERSLAHSPVFQVTFALHRSGRRDERLALGDLAVEPFQPGGDGPVAKFDLELDLAESDGGMGGALLFRRALFEAATVERMAAHLELVLAAMAADPKRRLSELSLLRPAERVQVLEAWNAPAAEAPQGSIHELFAGQAARTPGGVALVCGAEALTYAELDGRADRLARALRRKGVGPERVVGIFMEHSLDAVVALLATLKAGGCGLLLDPEHPEARIAYLLEDAGVDLAVAQPHPGGLLPRLRPGLRVLEPAVGSHAEEGDVALPPRTDPESAAYLVYTSGSTGQPKGVLVSHRAAATHMVEIGRVYGLTPADRMLVLTVQTFDPFLEETLAPLLVGATAVLRGRDAWTPDEFAGRVGALGITVADMVPAYFAQLAREPGVVAALKRSLRLMILGGEALPPAAVLAWEEGGAGGARLLNAYGPTEAVVTATVHEAAGRDAAARGASVPIGRGVAGRTTYVLDERGEPVPVGLAGELYLGGAALARGYVGRPELTAERFVPDPFADVPGARLYRTGDRVRWLAGGELEFLGRVDAQVKVRGFRIEPGEIEAVLLEQEGVREAVVAVREDAPDHRRLVAYVVAEEGAEVTGAALRERLSSRLPEYMVPGAFVLLEQLPLSSSGKLDRGRLPAPEHAGAGADRAPRTATEEVLAGIWAEVLEVERVGADDDFFHLGGHSLLAMQVVSRVRHALGVEVPLRTLFEASTVAALAARVAALRGEGGAAAPPIVRVPREGALPASFAQQRLWVVDRLEPGSAAYNMAAALRMRGALDVDALRRSLDALVERHETLRTTLEERGGEPVQVVHAPAPAALDVVEVADEAEAARLAAAEARRPFDLAAGPLLRCTLLRLGAADHVVCFTLHHVAGDAWSSDVLVREFSAFYGAFSRGEEIRLPELPVQYADYAVWQRAWLAGDVLEEQVGWWKERLAGAPPLLELPLDRPRAPEQSAAAAPHAFALSPELSAGLRALARREGATLFMTALAGWQALLGRWSGQEDVVVGTPIAGRTRRETEGLIGFFVNMLVLRAELGGGATWRELLGQVREGALGAYAHQELPFERLVEELATERSLAHTPLFQVTFSLERAPSTRGGPPLGGLELEAFGSGQSVAQFDLDLTMVDVADALHGSIRFRTALFDEATVARLAGDLETLLAAMVAAPEGRVAGVRLLPDAERAQVLAAGRGETRPFDRDALVHELIAARAAASPELAAVSSGGRTLSYGELDAEAGRLAARLRSRGVGPEVPVALFFDRSAELAVALLGVLRAGGAFVPIDPDYPRERLEYLLADSGARVVVTRSDLAAALPESAAEMLCVDDAEDSAAASGPAEAERIGSDALAYLIYTSGSTGRPKAAMVSHRSLVCYAEAMRERMGLTPADRVLQFASPAFDVMIEEVFPAWLSGACVVFPGSAPGSPRELTGLLEAERVSVVELPTAFWQEWVRETASAGAALPESLRLVLVGGERVLSERLAQWAELRRPLLHVFGLTETTVTSTTLLLEAGEDGSRWPNLPVGTPLANAEAYVLDAEREPVAAGIPGELYLGGETVARGYRSRPELTAERYVPHPFSTEPGARLYRTGDRVRMLAEGGLEFLGRIDQQVKIRGYRIEPAEVEAVLGMHPSVREAAVVVRPDARGDNALVAYVSADAGAGELRTWMRERLPEYMVPGAIVALERLPLSPNGKVDRRALPAPEWEGGAAYVAPRTPAEAVLAGTWAEVLRLERVGVEESFFELGGHSLLAMQVVSRVREALGVELPLRALFEAPTVAGLAARVAELRRAGAGAVPPLVRVARGEPLPASFAQRRLWLVDRLEPGSAAYNVPFALRLRGALDVGALRASLEALVARHETLRTTFAEEGGEPVQVINAAAPVALEVVEVEDEAAAERIAREEALRPFDLEAGPLLRATLLRLGAEEHVLCFTLHHIVSDGWSMQVLVREVSALYGAASHGGSVVLPELPVQYADYAVWQRGWLAGEVLEEQIGFWKERLAGAPQLLEVPTDRPRAPGQGPLAQGHGFALSPELSAGLRALARREGATLFMALLAGWQALLSRYSGQEDLVVGTPIAGRTRRETEGLIGFFVNMLALRAELGGDPTWAELLGRVRQGALEAYDHAELPFERLVEELRLERSLTHSPLFQAIFSLDEEATVDGGGALSLGELGLEPFGTGGEVSKFDLKLSAADREEGVSGALVYRTALFDAATAARMAGHLEVLLAAMVADPSARVGEVPLLSAAEREQVLEEWNATDAEIPRGLVHERIAEQAVRTPDAPAVVSAGRTLTYAELEGDANRLAHHLRALGVGPDARVGFLLERSAETVVTVLGILKAGAAYVALDPAYPDERLRFMLADAGAVLAVSNGSLTERLAGFGGALVRLDTDAEAISARPQEAPESGAGPQSLAYVIYTSGSTGTPRGVLLEHRGLSNYLAWFDRAVLGEEGFALPMVSRLSFDAHVRQLFPPLLRGEAVWVLPEATVGDPEALLEALSTRERVSFGGVPSLWSAMLERIRGGESPKPAGLVAVLLGGEALPAELAERTFAEFPDVALWNHYGPTEATVNTTVARVRPGGRISIGRPVSNVRVYLLDAYGSPVPVGAPGELHVGGVGVSRGYLGRPELTAERYLPDPFSGEAGARMYRSGDRVRWRGDGELEYVGRTDFQVKVRGYRIELGEIEAALERHPAVREAVALVLGDGAGEPRLVGYVVPEAGEAVEETSLREYLAERVPEYMVPGSFVTLAALPRTPNGKTDRRALPAPEWEGSGEGYVAPTTPTEEGIAAAWAEVLRVERVGIHDNFFALGGHSLLATRVVSRLRQELGRDVPLRAMFENPTVAGLAAAVDAMGDGGQAARPMILGREEAERMLERIDELSEEEVALALRALDGGEEA